MSNLGAFLDGAFGFLHASATGSEWVIGGHTVHATRGETEVDPGASTGQARAYLVKKSANRVQTLRVLRSAWTGLAEPVALPPEGALAVGPGSARHRVTRLINDLDDPHLVIHLGPPMSAAD